uniref:40S ribosomal protein S15 n=1 Tax=Vespula pensylvanica TaxID=30213 RepID=A0A834NZ33_VESPE|nr:hypothetical protein H0235_009748 [Vespula pensylvanica]
MAEADETQKKKRTFRKFTFRGVDLDQLLDMPNEQLMDLMHARARRRFSHGLKRKSMALVKKLRKAKKETPPNEKPEIVKTHLRNMIIVPEMVGSIVGVYNGKTFNQVEIKPEMIGHYLGEFSVTYKPVKHGRPVIETWESDIDNYFNSVEIATNLKEIHGRVHGKVQQNREFSPLKIPSNRLENTVSVATFLAALY